LDWLLIKFYHREQETASGKLRFSGNGIDQITAEFRAGRDLREMYYPSELTVYFIMID
jgi:hypothetical protein